MVAATRHGGRTGGRLTRRAVAVSVLVSAVIGVAFFCLAAAIDVLRDSEAEASHTQQVIIAANCLERVTVDVETTERGYVITDAPEFLPAWYQAQQEFAHEATVLEGLARAGDPGQGRQAQQIADAGMSYIRDYSVPVVTAAQRDPASARTVAVTAEEKREIDALRGRFDQFMNDENHMYTDSKERADATASRAFGAASASVAASIVLILLSGAYLSRSVVRPVRRASAMAGRVAGGDLTVRMPATGPGEVGDLQRSFNSMADSLEASHKDVRHALDELAASRARVVAAADETRRRIERDLHDGTQQRLISLALQLQVARASVPPEQRSLAEHWSRASDGLTEVIGELREISRGLHPAFLERDGLGPALRALARRATIPVEVSVRIPGRLPRQVEAAVYYVVSEALTNAAKYARAAAVQVDVDGDDHALRLVVRDDGVGGADLSHGSGLIGLIDRVEAVGGHLEISSPRGGGTTLAAAIPLPAIGQA
jgi:signal transduction histidine kinase